MMISTQYCSNLPDRHTLQSICKSISVIDAIIAEDWLDRTNTFNSNWADNEEFAGMVNAEGELLILFRNDGCVINGMAYNYHPKDKSTLTKGLPKIYDEFMFGEPVQSIGTTFCIWTNNKNVWQTGQPENFDDGSEKMLSIFDGEPQTYIDQAKEHYGDAFVVNENSLKVVTDIYRGIVMTKSMVLTINKDMNHWQQLKEDLAEINYPDDIF